MLSVIDTELWLSAVVEIEEKVAISACYEYNYRYVIIKPDDFVVPPIDYDNIQTDKMA